MRTWNQQKSVCGASTYPALSDHPPQHPKNCYVRLWEGNVYLDSFHTKITPLPSCSGAPLGPKMPFPETLSRPKRFQGKISAGSTTNIRSRQCVEYSTAKGFKNWTGETTIQQIGIVAIYTPSFPCLQLGKSAATDARNIPPAHYPGVRLPSVAPYACRRRGRQKGVVSQKGLLWR